MIPTGSTRPGSIHKSLAGVARSMAMLPGPFDLATPLGA